MATTKLVPIYDIYDAISYATSHKQEKYNNAPVCCNVQYFLDSARKIITYITLVTTLWCTHPLDPIASFKMVISAFGATEILNGSAHTKSGAPIVGWYLLQSFAESPFNLSPTVANKIGQQLVKKLFPGQPTIVCTHTNTDNIHNHIIICAYNIFERKKINGCIATYDQVRTLSDQLCDEYGLNVLEHTRERKLCRWFDKKGNYHFFEPSTRKLSLIKERSTGNIYPDRINSYRNTTAFTIQIKKRTAVIDNIKYAIDSILPYEHTLPIIIESSNTLIPKSKDLGYDR